MVKRELIPGAPMTGAPAVALPPLRGDEPLAYGVGADANPARDVTYWAREAEEAAESAEWAFHPIEAARFRDIADGLRALAAAGRTV